MPLACGAAAGGGEGGGASARAAGAARAARLERGDELGDARGEPGRPLEELYQLLPRRVDEGQALVQRDLEGDGAAHGL